MDSKTKSKISFNRQAEMYDTSIYSKYPRECYPYVIEEIKKINYRKVLDLGCGTGAILEKVNKLNTTAELFGLDLSENMIKKAKQRLNSQVKLSIGDAENIPFDNNYFDFIYCVESFHHYPNPQKALSEIKRVLKPNGSFLLCDTWARFPVRQILNLFIGFSNDGDIHIYSESEIKKLLSKIDLNIIYWKKITNHAFLCSIKK